MLDTDIYSFPVNIFLASKTSSRHVLRTSSRNVFKTSSKLLRRNNFHFPRRLEEVNCYAEVVFKTSSRRLGDQQMFAGYILEDNSSNFKNIWLTYIVPHNFRNFADSQFFILSQQSCFFVKFLFRVVKRFYVNE